MSSSQEAPALIQYACERCKTRFVLPPSSRKLSLGGKFKALSTGFGRAFKFHEGLGAAYDSSRRQLLAKMDDEAYQSFVQSFRFCHECRQFVCNECWSSSRRSCLTCVAKSMTGSVRPRPPFAPTGPEIPRPALAAAAVPRRGRLRRDAIVVALCVAVVMLVLEAGALVIAATTPGATPGITYVNATASPSATATPAATAQVTATAGATATATATATPTATESPSPSPSLSPSPTLAVTAAPTKTPKPTAPPFSDSPTISCSGTTTLVCSLTNPSSFLGSDTKSWLFDGVPSASGNGASFDTSDMNAHSVQLRITRSGRGSVLSNVVNVG